MNRRSASRRRRRMGWMLGLALACAALAAPRAAAADFSPDMTALIAAAKAEGGLTLSWGEGTFGGTQGAPLYEQAIKSAFGVDLPIQFTPGSSMPQVGNDIAMRQAAGQPSPTDVYVGYADVLSRLVPRNLFLAAPWQKYPAGADRRRDRRSRRHSSSRSSPRFPASPTTRRSRRPSRSS